MENHISFLNNKLYADPEQNYIWIDEKNRFGFFVDTNNNEINIILGSIKQGKSSPSDVTISLNLSYSEWVIFKNAINKPLNKIGNPI